MCLFNSPILCPPKEQLLLISPRPVIISRNMKALAHYFTLCMVFLGILACSAPYRLIQTLVPDRATAAASPQIIAPSQPPDATATTARRLPSPTARRFQGSATPTNTEIPNAQLAGSTNACSFNPVTAGLLENTSAEQWLDWVSKLSGAEPVIIEGEETRIETRFSPSLFDGQANARAFDWLLEQLQQWYPPEQIEVQPFTVEFEDQQFTWKNLVLTLPGERQPDEIVILAAHLDSTSDQPTRSAPGADDNGSGSATLIEAARLFRDARFARTIQIVWFTGEEQGLFGSQAFVKRVDPHQIAGVVNLDMFGYDSDNDRCFELHVGTLPVSQAIGQCVSTSIQAYELGLKFDYLEESAIDRSDHGSFWEEGIGAVELLEDLFDNNQPNGCVGQDPNPHYHTRQDVIANLNPETAFAIAKAGLAAVAGLAQPIEAP